MLCCCCWGVAAAVEEEEEDGEEVGRDREEVERGRGLLTAVAGVVLLRFSTVE